MVQKNLEFHAGVKKCHFDNFSEWAGMAVPCQYRQYGPQESLPGTQKFFLLCMRITPYKDWKVKLERVHIYKIQSGKITVCTL